MSTKWVRVLESKPKAIARLICFHHAGGTAQSFVTWNEHLPKYIELCAVQLPGRAERIQEPFIIDPQKLVSELEIQLQPYLDLPYSVLGFSFGSLLAYFWLNKIRSTETPLPLRFFINSCRAPQLPRRPLPTIGRTPEEFIASMNEHYGKTLTSVSNDKKYIEVLIRVFGADFELIKNMSYEVAPPFSFPFNIHYGAQDLRVQREDAIAWQHLSSWQSHIEEFQGGHFFVESNKHLFFNYFTKVLENDFFKSK